MFAVGKGIKLTHCRFSGKDFPNNQRKRVNIHFWRNPGLSTIKTDFKSFRAHVEHADGELEFELAGQKGRIF
jgi:hypothetical protein